MKPIDYLKFQAKNLFRDFKTQTPYVDPITQRSLYRYNPKYFDIAYIVPDFKIDEAKFTLMNAQHIIARIAGFRKWTDMLNVSEDEQELAKLLFDNQHKISAPEWEMYIIELQSDEMTIFDSKTRLEIFQKVFALGEVHESYLPDYRLNSGAERVTSIAKRGPDPLITYLPLSPANSRIFMKSTEKSFERVIAQLKPLHPELMRNLWNPENFINFVVSKMINLPITRNHALGLVDGFLPMHVKALAAEAAEMANQPN